MCGAVAGLFNALLGMRSGAGFSRQFGSETR